MSILKNAVNSIAVGLEDFESSDRRRLVSATRNIYAGILLLFKHKLAETSPTGSDEALLKEHVFPTTTPSGDVLWKGRGKKTVDVKQIHQRFEGLGISVDWRRLYEINDYRNNIEHYYSSLSRKTVQDIIAKSFLIIRDFIVNHLAEDPRSLLGEGAWKTLVAANEVYRAEKDECITILEKVDWSSETLHFALLDCKCEDCGSDLITISRASRNREQNEFQCRACGCTWEFEDLVERALDDHCSWQNFIAYKDGGEVATVDCPRCFKKTYVIDEHQCANCLEELEHTCERCGTEIPPEELFIDSGYCGWCDHMLSKDD